MTGVRTALDINEGIIKVVAPEGCGKSAFCRELVQDLKTEGHDVIFFETPPESVEFLHKRIQSELDLPRDKTFTRSLTNYLLAKQPPNNKLILVYDDAEKISKDIFILIRLLNNIHASADTLVSQVICGTGKLDKVFDDPDLRSLTQYLNQSFILGPMAREHLEDFYTGYRTLIAAPDREISNETLTDIFMVGKGMPGKTLELLTQHHAVQKPGQKVGEQVGQKVGRNDGSSGIATTTPGNPAKADAAIHYAREVEKILNAEIPRKNSPPGYFKIALSVIVVFSAIVLAVVLSGENELVNNRTAQILADDSPLYVDEVATLSTPPITEIGEADSGPAAVAVAQTPPATTEVPAPALATGEPASLDIAAEVVSEAATLSAQAPVRERVEAQGQEQAQEVAKEVTNVVTNVVASNNDETREPALKAPGEEEVRAIISQWLAAWKNGDYSGYLASYHDAFMPSYHDSRQAWEGERESRIAGVNGIDIRFDSLDIVASDPEEVTARFWLYYSRGNYADETLKQVLFRLTPEGWLIQSERNLELIIR